MIKRTILLLLVTLLMLTGCKDRNQDNITSPVFNWNGHNYIVTNEPIPNDEIEEKIGEIKEQTTDLPTKHEEGYRLDTGTNIYKIRGVEITNDIDSKMAIEIEGEYRVARIIVNIK
ncbi:hypothetical protein ACIQV0_08015 [Lysinibacillus capsici]|uniref:hypothetical protein n=1 Tax=Lysinibacillus capsici TaxID=2115968 RepID=UPI0021523108|nr:hypothetical protein [Lysinibacillus capsici]MCR6522639.1 hypothetical protein [Lysinibacillus capsici]